MRSLYLLIIALLFGGITNAQTYNFYYGNLHAHTGYSDGNSDGNSPTPAHAFTYAKSSLNFDFMGISEHNHNESTNMSIANWNALKAQTAAANQDGTFVCLYGMEWGTISTGGHFLIYGYDSLIGWNPGAHQKFVAKGDYASLYPIIKNKPGAFAVLAHPNANDFGGYFTGNYNAVWDDAVVGLAMRNGPSESANTTYDNPSTSNFNARYQQALRNGYHIAPNLDHDNHRTTFGRTTQGRTVVLATSLTHANIMAALRERRFYASDDWNLKINYTIGGKVMGSITTQPGTPTITVSITDDDGEIASNIELYAGVPGSGTNATLINSRNNSNTLTFTDNTLANLATKYYYLVVNQPDGHRAWSAPIWYTRNDGILPVEFTRFTGISTQDKLIQLSWTTASEYKNDRFEVERSVNGGDFEKIGEVKGQGDSKNITDYSFSDEKAIAGINYYRLKQIDIDGVFDYSKTIAVALKKKSLEVLSHRFRNEQLTIGIESGSNLSTEIKLIDITGKTIIQQRADLVIGINTIDLNSPEIAPGIYTIQINSGEEKFVKKIQKN